MIKYFRTSRRIAWQGKLNLTPLVDITFQLIVFFMVVSQVVTAEREPMQLPSPADSQAKQKTQADRIVINLFADEAGQLGKIKVNAQPISDLPALVDMMLRLGPVARAKGTSVILRADKTIRYDQIEPVLKALSNASVGLVEIATEMEVIQQ